MYSLLSKLITFFPLFYARWRRVNFFSCVGNEADIGSQQVVALHRDTGTRNCESCYEYFTKNDDSFQNFITLFTLNSTIKCNRYNIFSPAL